MTLAPVRPTLDTRRPVLSPLLAEAVAGLEATRKTLPCKLLYDAEGSRLFDRITELPEYYPTRTEADIMRKHASEIARAIAPDPANTRLLELGSGSSVKPRLLLDRLPGLDAYVPVDISEEHLLAASRVLQKDYPAIPVLPVVADYDRPLALPEPARPGVRTVVYFPGSTLGNFAKPAARRFLQRLAAVGDTLLIGLDQVKPLNVLLPAYDDAAGVTAAFNLNLLRRLNREADADFEISAFRHEARWDADHQRVEMHLVSERDQTVSVAGREIAFAAGESIWTESSHKYTAESLDELAEGWGLREMWMDERGAFAVHRLVRDGALAG